MGINLISSMSSRISKLMPETAQQKYPSLISQDGHFVNGDNGIHSNTHKRNINLKGGETYLKHPERNGVVFHESIVIFCINISHQFITSVGWEILIPTNLL
jgi:hypothetical protein